MQENTLRLSETMKEDTRARYNRYTKEHEHKHCWKIYVRATMRYAMVSKVGEEIVVGEFKIDGANRMLMKRSFICSFIGFGEVNPRISLWSHAERTSVKPKYHTSHVPRCFLDAIKYSKFVNSDVKICTFDPVRILIFLIFLLIYGKFNK